MNIFEAVRSAESDDWKDAAYWLFWTVFGMMPLWLLFLPLMAFSQPVSLQVFGGNGEFALYSAGILSGAIYVITKEIKPSFVLRGGIDDDWRSLLDRLAISFPSNRPLITCAIVLVVVSAAVFMMATLTELFSTLLPGLPLNQPFVSWFSLSILILSTILSFMITVVDNASMEEPELGRLRQIEIESLGEELDRVREDD